MMYTSNGNKTVCLMLKSVTESRNGCDHTDRQTDRNTSATDIIPKRYSTLTNVNSCDVVEGVVAAPR